MTDLWDAFNDAQSMIEEIEPQDEEAHMQQRNTFEDKYFSITVELETLISNKEEGMLCFQSSRHSNVAQASLHFREGTPATQGVIYQMGI